MSFALSRFVSLCDNDSPFAQYIKCVSSFYMFGESIFVVGSGMHQRCICGGGCCGRVGGGGICGGDACVCGFENRLGVTFNFCVCRSANWRQQ